MTPLFKGRKELDKGEPIFRLSHITKHFGSVAANEDISLEVYQGEILALLGENGSGKTTLMNMISGIYFPDRGQMYFKGKRAVFASPADALSKGIGMIHQHFRLVDVFSALENIVLGQDEGKLNLKMSAERIREICERYGFEVNLEKKVYDMSVSEKQTVEIVKALYRNAELLILDEPTAVLTPQEAEKLFCVLRSMREDGKAVIIITHKLQEVMELSDRVAILRKGRHICDFDTKKAGVQELTDAMVGHSVVLDIHRSVPDNPRERIVVEGLTVRGTEGTIRLQDVSFHVRSGEILGIAGIAGNGQKELLEAIAGLQPVEKGSIRFVGDDENSVELVGMDPQSIRKIGISLAFVPEDRLGMGLVANMDIADNMLLRLYRSGKGAFTDRKRSGALAKQVVDRFAIDTPGITTMVRRLSGGNVQKVLVGREISTAPAVLMTAYAVRGLDIHSSYTIYALLNRQKESGVAVIYVGEDLDVLLELSDRVMVLCDGRVSGIVDARATSKQEVGCLMTRLGGNKNA